MTEVAVITDHVQPRAPGADYQLLERPAILRVQVGDTDEESPAATENDEDTYAPPRRRKRKASAYEQNLSDLREMAHEDPRMVAMIVRSWMNKHD